MNMLLIHHSCCPLRRPIAILEVANRPSSYAFGDLVADDLPPLVEFVSELGASIFNALHHEVSLARVLAVPTSSGSAHGGIGCRTRWVENGALLVRD